MKILNALYIMIMIGLMQISFMQIDLSAQSIKMVRTDVDSSRAYFVTATYLFGVDVVLQDIENCNAAAFELAYNATDYIRFSESSPGTFGNGSKLVVVPEVDESAKMGRITVMVISGEAVDTAQTDNPTLVHLEFAVSQASPHGTQVAFSFSNPHAVVATDSIGHVVELTGDPIVYNIHGFIDVWPGDTDNNGVVEHEDLDTLGLYFGWGSDRKNMRSFKRKAASILWQPQRALAWDSAHVTYADCDGNGDITADDFLVIKYNLARLKTGTAKATPNKLQSDSKKYSISTETSRRIPIYANSTRRAIGTSAKITWTVPAGAEVLGFEPGNVFDSPDNYFFSYIDKDNNRAELAEIPQANVYSEPGSAVFAYLIVENAKESEVKINCEELTGMSEFGQLFPMQALTSIDDHKPATHNNNIRVIDLQDGSKEIHFADNFNQECDIIISNASGEVVAHFNNIDGVSIKSLPLRGLLKASGAYYLSFSTETRTETIPFIYIR